MQVSMVSLGRQLNAKNCLCEWSEWRCPLTCMHLRMTTNIGCTGETCTTGWKRVGRKSGEYRHLKSECERSNSHDFNFFVIILSRLPELKLLFRISARVDCCGQGPQCDVCVRPIPWPGHSLQ